MALPNYRNVTIKLPCGKTWVGQGPRRPQDGGTSWPDPHKTEWHCTCGKTHWLYFDPIMRVVGYNSWAR